MVYLDCYHMTFKKTCCGICCAARFLSMLVLFLSRIMQKALNRFCIRLGGGCEKLKSFCMNFVFIFSEVCFMALHDTGLGGGLSPPRCF